MDQQELKNILELHRKWVMNEKDGKRADLRSADLSSADLRSADLSYANLSSANLRSADLSYANLSYANLSYANLSYANLSSANLSYANLSSADLRSANLSSADLSYANLSYANLSSANLRYANLTEIRDDFYKVLAIAKSEAIGLYDALIRGNIDGTVYEGECACLVGTIANLRHEAFKDLKIDLRPDSDRMAERWFLGIQKGDTPENNSVSKLTSEWMREWFKQEAIAYPDYKLVSSLEHPALFVAAEI